MSAASWVHCGRCMELATAAARHHITSCGRIVCNSCLPSLSSTTCPTCRGPCTRTIPIGSNMPTTVSAMFKDPAEQLKPSFKTISWQEAQRRELIEYREKVQRRVEQEERRLAEELAGLERELERKQRELASLEQEEASLKTTFQALTRSSRGNPANSTLQQGLLSSSFYQGMAEHSPCSLLNSSRRSAGSSGSREAARPPPSRPSTFLQLKTPARWHAGGRGGAEEGAPHFPPHH